MELSEFFQDRWSNPISVVNIREGGKYERTLHYSCEIQEKLKALKEIEGKPLTVYGHGSYHHYTYGLVGNVMPQRTNEFLYIHIDMHTDAGINRQRCNCLPAHGLHKCGMSIGCGSFVEDIADHGAKNFLFIGTDASCGWKRKRWVKQDTLLQSDSLNIIERELGRKRCNDVYISMDLDVLASKELPTGYGRGKISLRHLLDILTVIQRNKNVLGADILGLCKQGGGSYYHGKNRDYHYYQPTGYFTYAIIAAHLMGKDYYDALKLRDTLMHYDANNQNGVPWEELAWGLEI
jgi:arginase family enzyme